MNQADMDLTPEAYEYKFYTPAQQVRARRERGNQRIWGYGLTTRRHFGRIVGLRRNLYVYEIEINFWRIEINLVLRRRKLK